MMTLQKILDRIDKIGVRGETNRFVPDIQYDSRLAGPDQAFIAVRGFTSDGHDFIPQAYERGARVFFVEKEIELLDSTVVRVKDTRKAMAQIARVFFNNPEEKLKIVGITGTTGKTTTAYLVHSILNQAHWKPGLVTTIESFDGKRWEPAERTTPESLDLFRMFDLMVRSSLKSTVMEVSSHALSLHRVDGVPFVANVFTNLGRDHLDFHKTMEDYFHAKSRMFRNLTENQKVVLNWDDPYSQRIRKITEGEVFTFSMDKDEATVRHISHQVKKDGMQILLATPEGEVRVETPLLGDFNIYNILAAVTTAVSLGLQSNFIAEGIREMKRIPGRCEYYSTSFGVTIYVDYAHTPEGLRNILKAIWDTRPENLIVVFGAGGDRDRGKRPQMGKAADDFADIIILTNDNPRSEEPEEIIAEIGRGIYDQKKVTVIPDRREAIRSALARAAKRDAVLVAGKGHETYQEIAGQKFPFDDHQVIEEYIKEKAWN
jgi:UDP-N-acetylmuramoyl-L-alanyl-D-glutamate--2,6-diaminopimelate ligase